MTKSHLIEIIKQEIRNILNEKPNLQIGKLRKPTLTSKEKALIYPKRTPTAREIPKLETLISKNIFNIAKRAYRDKNISLTDLSNLFSALKAADGSPDGEKAAALTQKPSIKKILGVIGVDIKLGKLPAINSPQLNKTFDDESRAELEKSGSKEIVFDDAYGATVVFSF